uniref:Putative ester hydrolase c11orf54-like protein n=1 Tax=Tabanus bromius TaxID=304241 RepID=A0A0K8TRB6_TABBR
MSALEVTNLLFEEKPLHVPTFEEVQEVLLKELPTNFAEVSVEVVDCPNLSNPPFHLVKPGLNGSPTLIEVGGAPYLLPLVDRSKVYDIEKVARKAVGKDVDLLAIGAGAGPYMLPGVNCEGIYNVNVKRDGTLESGSYYSYVKGTEESCQAVKIPHNEARFALLANIFASEGNPGKVLRVYCKTRTGNQNYIESIRLALAKKYPEQCVGLGGAFLLKSGAAKQHVMRDFSTTPIHTEEELNTWLKFYNMPAPLVAVGTLVTNEYDLDLRLQHFHSFSKSHWAGHYHIDTTPDYVEYEGYFTFGEKIVRVDKPVNTHKFGRD